MARLLVKAERWAEEIMEATDSSIGKYAQEGEIFDSLHLAARPCPCVSYTCLSGPPAVPIPFHACAYRPIVPIGPWPQLWAGGPQRPCHPPPELGEEAWQH